jgi:hypothetical protein
MSMIYKQVTIEEGLPEKEDWYMTNEGPCEFLPKDEDGPDVWFDRRSDKVNPKWWIDHTKELPSVTHVLTEEELRDDRLNFYVWATKRASTYAFGSDILEVLYSDYQQHLKDKEDGK